MRKKLKWYWKFLIILILMFIVGSCTQNGFIMQVHAEELTKPSIVLLNPLTGETEAVGLNQIPPYRSDFVSQENLEAMASSNRNPFRFETYYSMYNLNNEYVENNFASAYLTANTTYEFNTITGSIYFKGFDFRCDNYYGNISSLRPLHKNTKYTFVFEFYSNGANLSFPTNGYTKEDFNLGLSYSYNITQQESNYADMYNLVDIDEINFITPNDLGYTDIHYSYVLVSFTTNNLFPNDNGNDKYALRNLSLTLKNPNIQQGQTISNDYKYFIKSTSGGTFKVNEVYMISNYDVMLGDSDYSYLNGVPISSTKYEQCDTLDIACHLRNLTTGIESITHNIIYSIRQLFFYLFIPKFKNIQSIFTDFVEAVDNKLGIVAYPLELLVDIASRFLALNPAGTDNIVINISEVRDPFYNQVLIQGGTWHIGEIIHTGNIYQLYLIYKVFITAYIIYLFICFLYDTFSSFIAGDGGRVSTYTIGMIHDTDNTGETYGSYIRSHKI